MTCLSSVVLLLFKHETVLKLMISLSIGSDPGIYPKCIGCFIG